MCFTHACQLTLRFELFSFYRSLFNVESFILLNVEFICVLYGLLTIPKPNLVVCETIL